MLVYWIRPPNCTDIANGYIGVAKSLKKRMNDHKNRISRGTHDNPHLVNAIKKHSAVVDVLFEGTEEECFALERFLRPTRNIGWNIAEGGSKPPTQYGHTWNVGRKRPDRSKWMKELRLKGLCVYGVNKDRHWWNNGKKNKMSTNCPGDGWVKGRIGNLGGPKRCAVS